MYTRPATWPWAAPVAAVAKNSDVAVTTPTAAATSSLESLYAMFFYRGAGMRGPIGGGRGRFRCGGGGMVVLAPGGGWWVCGVSWVGIGGYGYGIRAL